MSNLYKKDFPIFSAAENKDLIYFDNAATTQRPIQVIEAIDDFYKKTLAINSVRWCESSFPND